MNDDTNTPTETTPPLTKEFKRRLAVLKAEVDNDFPGALQKLEADARVILVTDTGYAKGLNPDILRRLGGLIMLCSFYGAAVVFVIEN